MSMEASFLTNNTEEKWEEIKTHPFYKKERDELIAYGEKYLSAPIPELKLSSYLRFSRDGNRSEYERPYFERRRRIARLTILCRLYGERYTDVLEDLIWAVLEESTWVVPAHLCEDYTEKEKREGFLDLFSTETGALLSLTYHLLGDRLSSFVRERMQKMVRRRIIDPFFNNHFWWMEGRNNWGAVCASQVACCMMVFATENEFRRAEPSFNLTMNHFLASYGEDGCCLEGLSYWNYGFGSFLDYADAVRRYSKGKTLFYDAELMLPEEKREKAHDLEHGIIDYFKREDVRRAAFFAQNTLLTGSVAVSFSDGREEYRCTRAHTYLLKREYGDAAYGAPMKHGTIYYREGQWFIRKSPRFSLAAKGGHNDEAHNHNDIGSFLVTDGEGSVLCDLGAGEYTRQYFLNETRYDFLVNSSRGHSLPIINGELQKTGKTRAVAEKTDNDHFRSAMALRMSYPI